MAPSKVRAFQTEGGKWKWIIDPKLAQQKKVPATGEAPHAANELEAIKAGEAVLFNTRGTVPAEPAKTGGPTSTRTETPVKAVEPVGDDRLYIFDGNNAIHRAYWAVKDKLTDPDGNTVNALFGFTRSLIKTIKTRRPAEIVVVLDHGRKTFRNEIYPDYKANRKDTPVDLTAQIPMVKSMLSLFGIKTVEKAGYEADDIIGTLAKQHNGKVVVVTRDKDLMQIVDEKIEIYDPKEDKFISTPQVFERFGVAPDKVIDILALAGDTIDNIPGVYGIGEDIAAKFIAEYGSLEALIAAAPGLKGKRPQNIVNEADNARMSKLLATIVTDVPGISKESCGPFTYNPNDMAIHDRFMKLGFVSIIKELPIAVHSAAAVDTAIREFKGEYQWASNFFTLRKPIIYGNLPFKSTEHLYNYMKTLDPVWRERIRTAPTAAEAKKIGRQAPLRENWDNIRIDAMRVCLKLKFKDPELRAKLLATGNRYMEEGNTWKDKFWGVCDGKGMNYLGKLLMKLRMLLQAGKDPWPSLHHCFTCNHGRGCSSSGNVGCLHWDTKVAQLAKEAPETPETDIFAAVIPNSIQFGVGAFYATFPEANVAGDVKGKIIVPATFKCSRYAARENL